MKQLTCEMCGGTDLVKTDGVFICQHCGCKYSLEEAKKMMIEGTVEVQGTVKIDSSSFVQKSLCNARRAYQKGDWDETEKYYNKVEENDPVNIEAVFFSAYAKAMQSFANPNISARQPQFTVLKNSISLISDYYEKTNEDKEKVIELICDAIVRMNETPLYTGATPVGSSMSVASQATHDRVYFNPMLEEITKAMIAELDQILSKHKDSYLYAAKDRLSPLKKKGCYVATCVYGSYDCPQVWTLRRYRDYTLAETWYGRAFISVYYAVSPTLVKWFGHTEWFKNMWRGTLDKMTKNLQAKGYESTPYKDKY